MAKKEEKYLGVVLVCNAPKTLDSLHKACGELGRFSSTPFGNHQKVFVTLKENVTDKQKAFVHGVFTGLIASQL